MNPARSPHRDPSRALYARRSADEIWSALTRAARHAVLDDAAAPAHPPLGFSARVAAHAFAARRSGLPSLLEQFSLRALGLAGLAVALAFAAHFSVPQSVAAPDEEPFFTIEDPAALVLSETGGGYE